MSKAKSKKATTITFTTVAQCVAAWVMVMQDYSEGQSTLDNAKALFATARRQVDTCARQTRAAGFTIGKNRATCEIGKAIYDTLTATGYGKGTAEKELSRIRAFVNTGKWPANGKGKGGRKTDTQGPISGITFELKPGAKPEQLVNKVKTLAEYVRAEYPNDERMLHLAAFLADIG